MLGYVCVLQILKAERLEGRVATGRGQMAGGGILHEDMKVFIK